jgi:hypothetical protein
MKKLLLLLPLMVLTMSSSFAQSGNNKAHDPKVSIAGATTKEVSIKNILTNPVVTLGSDQFTVVGFDVSWVVAAGKEPEYMGPYKIVGNTINGVALSQLESDAKKGRITRMYIDEVSANGSDGVVRKLVGAAYKVNP